MIKVMAEWWSWFLLRLGGGICPGLSLASGGSLAIFPWLVDLRFVFTWCSPCVGVSSQISPFYKDVSHTGLKAQPHSE